MSTYKVKEIYYTLQGEGAHSGRPAVFLRFTGCNLWSGREEDRSDAVCQFCDTDFIGMDGTLGGKYNARQLASLVHDQWPSDQGNRYVICTGGEPLLQLDEELINAFHTYHFEVGVETNGTIAPPQGLDWICVSPKANSEVVVRKGNELKLVVRQKGLEPDQFAQWDFANFYLQPMDGAEVISHTQWAMDYCLKHPQWKLSVQTHKWLGIR